MTVPSDRKEEIAATLAEANEYAEAVGYVSCDAPGVVALAFTDVPWLLAVVERYENALRAYHDLIPAVADCVNECGEALLYSQLHQANKAAEAALAGTEESQ